ncbi:MAG: HAD family hydrolase [Puniceicoccaceae bacterium]
MDLPPFPNKEFDAYIFDCDGTLVDSMPLHYEAWQRGLEAAGARTKLKEDLYYSMAGMSIEAVVGRLNDIYDDAIDPVIVKQEKEAFFALGIDKLEPIRPVVAFLRQAASAGVPIAVASGSERQTVERLLQQIGVFELLEVIVTPADVEQGKPAPDMFLLASRRLGVAPERCLVFEDGQSGIEAARAAGMKSFFVESRVENSTSS